MLKNSWCTKLFRTQTRAANNCFFCLRNPSIHVLLILLLTSKQWNVWPDNTGPMSVFNGVKGHCGCHFYWWGVYLLTIITVKILNTYMEGKWKGWQERQPVLFITRTVQKKPAWYLTKVFFIKKTFGGQYLGRFKRENNKVWTILLTNYQRRVHEN